MDGGFLVQDSQLEPSAHKLKPHKLKGALRTVMVAVIAGMIFLFGFGLGQGRIRLLGNLPARDNKHLPAELDYASVDEVYRLLKNNFDGKLDTAKLLDGAKAGLAKAPADPYTEYLTKDEYKDFNEELTGSFTGIGAELTKDKNAIIVVSPIAGFPADKVGLKPRDVIIEIDGKSAYDITVSDAVSRIRGPKGSKVTLKVARGTEEKTLEITRDNINIPSVEYKVEDGIGYMKISRFGDDTAKLSRQAANDFKQQHVKGVIVDLRGDPGGLLTAAIDVSSLWVPSGQQVLSERRDGVVINTHLSEAQGTPTLANIPTVVLINDGSASASEITAGALKDNGLATLIGIKSFGKGSVQQLQQLHDGSVLKVTVARWYTPSGKNIDKEGIKPDKKVEITEDDAQNNRDPQKDAAIADLKQ